MRIVCLARWVSLAIVAVVAAAGCSRSDLPKLSTVSGVVTLDGTPYSNAHVLFSPAQGRPAEGITDINGKYELRYLPEVKGAEPGDYQVSITTYYQSPEVPGSEPPFVETLPAKYNTASTLTAKVAPGGNEVNFSLTTK